MADAAVTAALRGFAQTLHDQARSEKHLEQHHRRKAAALRRQLDRLDAMCQAHGIELDITDTDPEEGSQS